MGNHDAALEFHTRAIEVLEWGRQVWRSVPKDDRGAIFEITFLRGVKSLRLDTMMRVSRARGLFIIICSSECFAGSWSG